MATATATNISLEAFTKLAHISKRKAKWLLENGHIPCIDTGKRTHRFMIPMKAVNKFLRSSPAKCPVGIFSSKPPTTQASHLIAQISPTDLRKYLTLRWHYEPDGLQIEEIAALLGYTCPTVRRWLRSGKLKYIVTQRGAIIPKPYLVSFISTYTVQHPGNLSSTHRALATTYLSDNSWQA